MDAKKMLLYAGLGLAAYYILKEMGKGNGTEEKSDFWGVRGKGRGRGRGLRAGAFEKTCTCDEGTDKEFTVDCNMNMYSSCSACCAQAKKLGFGAIVEPTADQGMTVISPLHPVRERGITMR